MKAEYTSALEIKNETKERQREVALEFIDQVKVLTGKHDPDLQAYIQEASAKIRNRDVNVDPSEIAANVFDVCLSDEIQVHEGELPLFRDQASVYYRSDVAKSNLVQTLASSMGTETEETEVILACDSNFISHYYPGEKYIQLDQQAGLLILDKDNVQNPICALEKHTLVQIMISLGINPLNIVTERALQTRVRSDFYPNMEKILRTHLVEEIGEEDMPILEASTERYWGEVLGNDNCLIFNSGAMANESVMIAVSRLNKDVFTYHDNSWYYENEESLSRLFTETERPEKANIYFSSLEPTNYFNLGSDKPLHYVTPEKMFNCAFERAVKNPKDIIYLIIDCTVDPLFTLPQTIPDNLIFIKTISSTKHQKGDRRFFSGICSISTNNSNLLHTMETEIKQARDETGSHARKASLVHFPTPTKEWLKQKKRRVSELNAQVSQTINSGNHGWIAYPFSYHMFLIPPKRLIEKTKYLTGQDLEEYEASISSRIRETIIEHANSHQSPNFEIGDSFGLPITRLHSQGGFSYFDNGKKFRIKIPRICFGYTTDRDEATVFTESLVKKLKLIE